MLLLFVGSQDCPSPEDVIKTFTTLLNAGADPWARDRRNEQTAFDRLFEYWDDCEDEMYNHSYLLMVDHERGHLLHKARNLRDAARELAEAKARAAAPQAQTQQLQQQQQQQRKYVPPPYVKQRVEEGWQLPLVLLADSRPQMHELKKQKEELMAVTEFVVDGGEGGMIKDVIFELIDMISPRWDPKRMEEEGRKG